LTTLTLCLLFGLGCHSYPTDQDEPTLVNLGELVEEFQELVPKKDLFIWFLDKASNDEDMKKLLTYITSDHFKAIDNHIWKSKNLFEFLNYLEDNDVKAYNSINIFRGLFNLGEIPEPPSDNGTESSGLIPIEKPDIQWELKHLKDEHDKIMEPHLSDIANWVFDKLSNNKDFQEFWEWLRSKKIQAVYHHIDENEQYQEFLQLLREGNIDCDKIIATIKELFEWK